MSLQDVLFLGPRIWTHFKLIKFAYVCKFRSNAQRISTLDSPLEPCVHGVVRGHNHTYIMPILGSGRTVQEIAFSRVQCTPLER